MIKILRDASHNYPWLIKSIMGILALVFVVTMGWWGFDEKAGNAVADVGDLSVSRDEFKRAFEFMYRSYKEKGAGEIKEETFKQGNSRSALSMRTKRKPLGPIIFLPSQGKVTV